MLTWLRRDEAASTPAGGIGVKQIATAFSGGDPCKRLEQAHPLLISINEDAALDPQRRFELLVRMDDAARDSQQRLAGDYVVRAQDDPQAKRLWLAAGEFWKLLGDGYLACARQCAGADGVPAAMRPQAALLAVRGLRALRHQLKWTLLRYGTLRTAFWGECGRFALLAEAVDGATRPLEILHDVQTSPNDELLRLIMFWLALPSGLSPLEQAIAGRLVRYVTPKLRSGAAAAEAQDYFFDLEGSRPPLRMAPAAPVGVATRFVDVSAARETLSALHSIVRGGGQLPADCDGDPAADHHAVIRVLRHLRTHWAKELPPRAAVRQRSGERLYGAWGFQPVLARVAPQAGHQAPATPLPSGDVWIAGDVSAGGCGVIVPQGKGDQLRVGMLVAMRTRAQSSWHIGIIRHVSEMSYRQHQLGIQLLSKAPLPVFLRSTAGTGVDQDRECGILLSEHPSSTGHWFILTRRGRFSGRDAVRATVGGEESSLTLGPGGVMESGHDFDWLYYAHPGHPA